MEHMNELPVLKHIIIKRNDYIIDGQYDFYCPACKTHHSFWTKKCPEFGYNTIWWFNGDIYKPTVTPSIKVSVHRGKQIYVCHMSIENGIIKYYGDCTHNYKNKSVGMLPIKY